VRIHANAVIRRVTSECLQLGGEQASVARPVNGKDAPRADCRQPIRTRPTQLKSERMDTPRNFQAGAFAGTAEAYLRYRPAYPAALLANLVVQAQLPASAVLLDLACGPGRVTLDLAGGFEHVNAIDLEAEMIEVGRREAARRGVRNVDWRVGRAEERVGAWTPGD
jgi:tRNA/tmRNA/rRNA uracil-C5-methylase (TrmA/RlmC/RlmD family)